MVIWEKVSLDESDIVHRLTQNTRNVVLPDTEYLWKSYPEANLSNANSSDYCINCLAIAEFLFSNILVI